MMDADDMQKVSKWLSGGKNILLYTGNPGCGKTYFCAAIINYCWPRFESCRCWTEKKLMEHLRAGIAEGHDYTRALSHMVDDEFMIYDDLGSTGFSEWRKEVIFELIDARYGSMKPTIVTSNLTYTEISSIYHERVWSRLGAAENTRIIGKQIDHRGSGGIEELIKRRKIDDR